MQQDVTVAEESVVGDLNKDEVEDGEEEEEDEFKDAAGLDEDGAADHGQEHIEREVLKQNGRLPINRIVINRRACLQNGIIREMLNVKL